MVKIYISGIHFVELFERTDDVDPTNRKIELKLNKTTLKVKILFASSSNGNNVITEA